MMQKKLKTISYIQSEVEKITFGNPQCSLCISEVKRNILSELCDLSTILPWQGLATFVRTEAFASEDACQQTKCRIFLEMIS